MSRAILEHHRDQLQAITGIDGVWITRAGPLRQTYPCFTLHDESEAVEIVTIHASPRQQMRDMTLNVTGWALYGEPEKQEADLYNLQQLAEQALRKHPDADDLRLFSIEKQLDEDDPKLSSVTLRFNVRYRTNEY